MFRREKEIHKKSASNKLKYHAAVIGTSLWFDEAEILSKTKKQLINLLFPDFIQNAVSQNTQLYCNFEKV